MDLSASWDYLEQTASFRLAHNKTPRHVSQYGPDIELMGAAGELAARRFLGLPETLHTSFDHGADIIWNDLRLDVKATHLTARFDHRFLQWAVWKRIKSDIVVMTAIDMRQKFGVVIGYAFKGDIEVAPINSDRETPCHEIPVRELRPAWELLLLNKYNLSSYFVRH